MQINESNIFPDFMKGSLTGKLKELCEKGVNFIVSDVVCAKQIAYLCEKPEILLRSKYHFLYINIMNIEMYIIIVNYY